MRKHEIINLFIKHFQYESYLEIGVLGGDNFREIICNHKEGIDPTKRTAELTYEMTSDDFFMKNPNKKYDVIFIDGHHDSEYVHRDINNSLKALNDGGIIFIHDCLPPVKNASIKFHDGITWAWCGDGFKVIHSIVKNYADLLTCCVVNTDWGVGILRKNTDEDITVSYDEAYLWETMMSNPVSELNVISVDELLETFKE